MAEHDFDTGPLEGLEGDSAIGQFLFDPTINFFGVLGVDQNGQFFLTDPNTGSTRPTRAREFFSSLFGQADQALKLDDSGNIVRAVSATKFLPDSGRTGGGGSRALSFQQQLDLQESGQQFQLEQSAAGQEFQTGERQESQLFQAAESSKARENAQRLALQSEINSLIGQAVSIRQRSRELLADTLGKDPFRSGALLRGQVQRGTTPTQAFRSQLHQTSEFEAPQVDFQASIPTLQGQAQDVREFVTTGLPDQPSFGGPGLARGGVIDMKKGRDGKFGVGKFGEAGQSVLVGEQGPEVMTINRGKVTITPLIGGAAHGGSFSTANLNPDPSSFTQALSPIFGAAGLPKAPRFSFGEGGNFLRPTFGGDIRASTLQQLNVQPRLVRSAESGRTYFITPDGQAQLIDSSEDFDRFGFNRRDIVTLTRENAQQLGLPSEISGTLTSLPDIEPFEGNFGPFTRPLLAPIGENRFLGLPDPASFIRTFGRLDRASQLGILSAFGTAGLGRDDFFERQDFFTPAGTARAGRTLGLG